MKKLRIGLVGLPNVGKSSFFEIVSKKQVLVANYPFSTICPNTAPVNFYDERVTQLGNFFKSEKITFDTYELVDIAGIIKGASQKIGLGGEFLSKIRSVDLVCHVVRCFKNDDVVHVEESVDSVRDIDTVLLELINADVQQVKKRLEKIDKTLKKENNKQLSEEKAVLQKIDDEMNKEVQISKMKTTKQERTIIKAHNLLTDKPSIIIANYNFDNPGELEKLQKSYRNEKIIPIDIGLETECKNFSPQEKEEFGYTPFNLQSLSRAVIEKLQLKSFFTAGRNESKN